MRSIPTTTTTTSLIAPSSLTSPPQSTTTWHSPVPYLFGGLAAMLGLIAFALLILACSYWKLSGQLQNDENDAERDLESSVGAEKQSDSANMDSVKVYEEKILVIMAGDQKPTFLATPIASSVVASDVPNHSEENHVASEKSDKEMENHVQQQPTSPQPQETTQQPSLPRQ